MGRDEYLQRLKECFSSTEGKRKSFLLYGLGGIGKTQICLKFIEENPDLFSDIYWLNASSEATLELGLKQIAMANNVQQGGSSSAASALKWISEKCKWLMVYDNADGHYSVVEKFLPPGNRGNILITSRNVELKRLTVVAENVVDMSDGEAVSLLLKSAMLDGASDHIKNMATEVVSEVGGIPLAVDQAGSFIQSFGCSINDYLELFRGHKNQLMSRKDFTGASGYGTSTYGTWDISMEQIENMAAKGIEQEAQAAQSAIRLLRTFAFLNHESIPEELFKNAAENYVERDLIEEAQLSLPLSATLLDYQTLLLNKEGEWDRMQLLDGIKVLLSFSLIKVMDRLYSMHPLVNEWSRYIIPKTEIADQYHRVRALLSCSIVLDWEVDNYAFCKCLAPHIRTNSLHELELKLESRYYDDEYERFALAFDHVGSWDEEEKLLLVAVEQRKMKLGSDHLETLITMHNLALAYGKLGRWDEAEELQLEVMNAEKAKLGPHHQHTLTGMHSLALTYWNQGRWDEAEELQVEVMNIRKAQLGSDHSYTLHTIDSLASTYTFQGRWDEAEKLKVEVLNARKAKLGSDHPDTLHTMHNLISTYLDLERWDEAEKMGVEVMNARKAKLGSDHPDTLITMRNLASTYWVQGRLSEAEKLGVEVMNASKIKLGPDHPHTLTTMATVAVTYGSQGRWDEAESLLSHAVQTMQIVMGSQHHLTLYYTKELDKLVEAKQLEEQGQLELESMVPPPSPSIEQPKQLEEQGQLENMVLPPSPSIEQPLAHIAVQQKPTFVKRVKGMWEKMKH